MKKKRIVIIDVLRGFALLLIVLIHAVEHFELFKNPEYHFLFTAETDRKVMDYTMFAISGKAYSIFALLFGLSFFIQMDSKAQKGINYSGKFLWRLTILFILGILHSLLYRGDILNMYALLALPIIVLYKVPTKALWGLVFLLIIQIPIIYQFFQYFENPEYQPTSLFKTHWDEGSTIYSEGSLLEVIKYNLWKGRESVWAWCTNNGRIVQLIALFIVGIIVGKKQVFHNAAKYKRSFIMALFVSIICFVGLHYTSLSFETSELLSQQKRLLKIFFKSFSALAGMTFYICSITLLYLKFKEAYFFKLLSAYGKMSLTNYISQALTGVILFYGFGFGLYKYLGSTWSLLLGACMFFTQAIISIYWNKKYYYGPLEWLWRCATDLSFNVKFKR